MIRIVLCVVALVLLCCNPIQARGPKVYYEQSPDGTMRFFSKGPRVRMRSYYTPMSQSPAPSAAPAAKPAAAPVIEYCPYCKRPLN